MSSMDQAFVKTFSRRRLAGSKQRIEPSSTNAARAESGETTKSPAADPSSSKSDVWFHPTAGQVARTDRGNEEVPRHHLDAVVCFDAPATNVAPQLASEIDRGSTDGTPFGDQRVSNPDPLQHIHTAYGKVGGDSTLVGAGLVTDPCVEAIVGVIETEFPLDLNAQGSTCGPPSDTSDVPREMALESADNRGCSSPPTSPPESTAMLAIDVISEEDSANEEESTIDQRLAVEIADSSTSCDPFHAVWEVDVFDVPTPVADLFFEGTLFQQIAERMSDAVNSGLRTVLVTSAKPCEGRSTVAVGLAMAAAAAGIRVALVDADTDSPSLADDLRLDLQYGWVDVIRQGLPIREIAVHAVEDGVTLIPLMPPGVRPAATAFEIVQMLDLLKSNFELIILDGPNSLSLSLDQCASKADSAVIVRDVTQTDEMVVAGLASRLSEAGVHGVGVVENFM